LVDEPAASELAQTYKTDGRRLVIRMRGESAINHLEAVLKDIVESDLPGSDLLIECHPDMLVSRFEDFRRALPQLEGSSHRIEVCLTGIKNSYSKELDEHNNRFDGIANLKALWVLFQLEHQWPKHFVPRRHGRLSLLTMTPWTEPEEVVLDLSIKSLLELNDEGPLDTTPHNHHDNEAPWRFANSVLDNVIEILLRMENHDVPAARDELTTKVIELVSKCRSSGHSLVGLARHIVQMAVIKQNLLQTELSTTDLLKEGQNFVEKTDVSHAYNEAPAPTPQDFLRGAEGGLRLPLECILDVKPVSKIEYIQPQQLDKWEACKQLPNLKLVKRPDNGFYDAFFGRNLQDVCRSIELTFPLNELARPDADSISQEQRNSVAEIGKLFGYPECCSKALAFKTNPFSYSGFWMHVARRVAAPDLIPFELHPASIGLEFIPCKADCEVALERARLLLKRLEETAPEKIRNNIEPLQNPTLLFSDEQGAMVELIPLEDPLTVSTMAPENSNEKSPGTECCYRFRFQVGKISERIFLADYIKLADEISIGRERVTLYRQGRPFIPLSGQVFVWWYKHVFQRDFWKAMLEAKMANPHAATSAMTTTEVQEVDSKTVRATNFLARLFKQLQERSFAGYKIGSVVIAGPGEIHIGLQGSGEPFDIIVDIRPNQTAALAKIGKLTLRHPPESPINSTAQWSAFNSLKDVIKQILSYPKTAS